MAIFIILFLSWIILRLVGENIKVLGLFPTRQRSIQFLFGFFSLAFLAMIYYLGIINILDADVMVNNSYSFSNFLHGFWWTLRSVLFEEFLFRGALLWLAIKYTGKHKGILFSAIVFGVYHWFSYDVFGDLTAMIYTLIITGISGLVFAYAFTETGSLYFPIGLHFGWNLVTITVFSQGPLGEQLLISSTENTLGGGWRFISSLYQVTILPVAAYSCLFYLNRRNKLKKKETDLGVFIKRE